MIEMNCDSGEGVSGESDGGECGECDCGDCDSGKSYSGECDCGEVGGLHSVSSWMSVSLLPYATRQA